jgi:hypothetical protein
VEHRQRSSKVRRGAAGRITAGRRRRTWAQVAGEFGWGAAELGGEAAGAAGGGRR